MKMTERASITIAASPAPSSSATVAASTTPADIGSAFPVVSTSPIPPISSNSNNNLTNIGSAKKHKKHKSKANTTAVDTTTTPADSLTLDSLIADVASGSGSGTTNGALSGSEGSNIGNDIVASGTTNETKHQPLKLVLKVNQSPGSTGQPTYSPASSSSSSSAVTAANNDHHHSSEQLSNIPPPPTLYPLNEAHHHRIHYHHKTNGSSGGDVGTMLNIGIDGTTPPPTALLSPIKKEKKKKKKKHHHHHSHHHTSHHSHHSSTASSSTLMTSTSCSASPATSVHQFQPILDQNLQPLHCNDSNNSNPSINNNSQQQSQLPQDFANAFPNSVNSTTTTTATTAVDQLSASSAAAAAAVNTRNTRSSSRSNGGGGAKTPNLVKLELDQDSSHYSTSTNSNLVSLLTSGISSNSSSVSAVDMMVDDAAMDSTPTKVSMPAALTAVAGTTTTTPANNGVATRSSRRLAAAAANANTKSANLARNSTTSNLTTVQGSSNSIHNLLEADQLDSQDSSMLGSVDIDSIILNSADNRLNGDGGGAGTNNMADDSAGVAGGKKRKRNTKSTRVDYSNLSFYRRLLAAHQQGQLPSYYCNSDTLQNQIRQRLSHNRLVAKVALQKPSEWTPFQRVLLELLNQCRKRDPKQYFAWPITDLFVPGYRSVIRNPMDFYTIEKKIAYQLYRSVWELKLDVRTLCENALRYYRQSGEQYKCAAKLWLHAKSVVFTRDTIKVEMNKVDTTMTLDDLGFDSFIHILDDDDDDEVAEEEEEEELVDKDVIKRSAQAQPPPQQQQSALQALLSNTNDSFDGKPLSNDENSLNSANLKSSSKYGCKRLKRKNGDKKQPLSLWELLEDPDYIDDDDLDQSGVTRKNRLLQEVEKQFASSSSTSTTEKQNDSVTRSKWNLTAQPDHFVRQRKDGSTSLSFVIPTVGTDSSLGSLLNKSIDQPDAPTLASLVPPLTEGTTSLPPYQEPESNRIRPLRLISIAEMGNNPFCSHLPLLDSSNATLNLEETSLLLNEFGKCEEAFRDVIDRVTSQADEYLIEWADSLLNIVSHGEYSKEKNAVKEATPASATATDVKVSQPSTVIRSEETEEVAKQKQVVETQSTVGESSSSVSKVSSVAKSEMDKSEKVEIEQSTEKQQQINVTTVDHVQSKLDLAQSLLLKLESIQRSRLSRCPEPIPPSEKESELAAEVTNQLVKIIQDAALPRDVIDVKTIREAMGIVLPDDFVDDDDFQRWLNENNTALAGDDDDETHETDNNNDDDNNDVGDDQHNQTESDVMLVDNDDNIVASINDETVKESTPVDGNNSDNDDDQSEAMLVDEGTGDGGDTTVVGLTESTSNETPPAATASTQLWNGENGGEKNANEMKENEEMMMNVEEEASVSAGDEQQQTNSLSSSSTLAPTLTDEANTAQSTVVVTDNGGNGGVGGINSPSTTASPSMLRLVEDIMQMEQDSEQQQQQLDDDDISANKSDIGVGGGGVIVDTLASTVVIDEQPQQQPQSNNTTQVPMEQETIQQQSEQNQLQQPPLPQQVPQTTTTVSADNNVSATPTTETSAERSSVQQQLSSSTTTTTTTVPT